MTAVITLTASSLPVHGVDIDVDFDLALAGDTAVDPADPGALSIPAEPMPQVTQMDPLPPQSTQMDFEFEYVTAPAETAPQVVQTYVQLDPPLLVDAMAPRIAGAGTGEATGNAAAGTV
ncbi:hypothetical protein ABTY61_06445 [Kitasatospora sp. NPDC096128]|uniref:hypothetical protein n=1 Tax=Kitasatospora sp. NPDC096128 TaxID=3155547 RepID=UPI0033179996